MRQPVGIPQKPPVQVAKSYSATVLCVCTVQHSHSSAQVEKLLSMISHEEAVMQDKAKITLMEEATDAVKASFSENAELKKAALTSAIATLKGTKGGTKDPVQQAYMAFFADKKKAAEKIDAAAEAAAAREAIITKLNATAKNEGFYFQFDADGKPKMVV